MLYIPRTRAFVSASTARPFFIENQINMFNFQLSKTKKKLLVVVGLAVFVRFFPLTSTVLSRR
jgi:hypothetical protein